ncbi:MAG: hypothetical protein GY906_17275 [bacterium]|nr:hypothetical protein [bacterium]
MARVQKLPRRTLVLIGLLIGVLVLWAGVRIMRRGDTASGQGRGELVTYDSREVPELLPLLLGTPVADLTESDRNPFAYGPPPTPTPNLTPRPTRPPVPTRSILPTPTPRTINHNGKKLPMPPPKFDRLYLGYLGPDRSRVAVFRNGEEIEIAVIGDVMNDSRDKQTFILREVHYDSVEIGYVGYPEGVTTREALAEK